MAIRTCTYRTRYQGFLFLVDAGSGPGTAPSLDLMSFDRILISSPLHAAPGLPVTEWQTIAIKNPTLFDAPCKDAAPNLEPCSLDRSRSRLGEAYPHAGP